MSETPSSGQHPLIIVGTGRCGSTLLHRILAEHEQLGWLSPFNEVLPRQTWLSCLSRLYRMPLPKRIKRAKAFPKPFEAYRFWEDYLPGFSRRSAPQTAADVDPADIGPTRAATADVLRFQGKRRLLVKVTGWSRIAYFDQLYPDARFVALHRDPRSVVSSWIKAGWLDVTSAPGTAGWQWGEVPARLMREWEELGGGPVLSAALKVRLDLDDIATNGALFPERLHELSYEQLTRDPTPALRQVCEFAGLGWSPTFEERVRQTEVYDSTGTWRKHLSEPDAERVLEFMERTSRA